MLRGENEQLQREHQELQQRHDALEAQFSQQKQRVRNLEEDLTRMYRRQKRDAEARQAEHAKVVDALHEELERRSMELEDRSALVSKLHATLNGANGTTTLSTETAKEMDAFVAMCLQWQSRLASLSSTLQEKVSKMEHDEVQRVMQDMVQRVETEQRISEVYERERREREDTDTFESLERKVLEDRVLELEEALRAAKHVAQRHAADVESAKAEMARANAVRQQAEEKAAELSVQCEAQHVQLTLLREDLAAYQARQSNAELSEQNAELTREQHARDSRTAKAEERLHSLEALQNELQRQLDERELKLDRTNQQLKRLEQENEQLNAQVTALQATPTSQQQQRDDDGAMAVDDQRIERLLSEKSIVQQFLRCYYEAAEAKCRALSAQVTAFESRYEEIRKHADDSRQMLRMCSQVDGCDSVVRASILDVMTALENIR
ncbi:hypothetical protein PINS_up019019 [Pythium insidiosum]|nr:hypothetical protein PINS_up019019 [Pythium insidiosum]